MRLFLSSLLLPLLLAAADWEPRVGPELVDRSIALACQYLLASQQPEGNFHYLADARTGEYVPGRDNSVRQAGALWGLALCHREQPTPETAAAIVRGADFWAKHSGTVRVGRYLQYPGDTNGPTGTQALFCLALIDALRQPEGFAEADAARLAGMRDECLAFLLSLRGQDGHFAGSYRFGDGLGVDVPNPYYDGECLLTMVRAARYLGRDDLAAATVESGDAMFHLYVSDAVTRDPDSDQTKGFYQWGSMAFHELYDSGWPKVEVFAERTILLGQWMIDVHRTLRRTRNTAYACEGLAVATDLARRTGKSIPAEKFATVVDLSLRKLCGWQVGSPVANEYLQGLAPPKENTIGGVLNAADEPWLRIDATQHQVHALILARRYVYPAPAER